MNTKIQPYKPSFGAKYLYSEHLQDIAKYAVEHGKFEKLNQARKNLSKYKITTRLKVDICSTDGYPTVIFTRFEPKKDVPVALTMNDYEQTKQVEYISPKKSANILKYALNLLIKIGQGVPENKIYKAVVTSPRDKV